MALEKEEPPLVEVKVTNPITYLKIWFKKILGNEGIDIHLKIKPLTTIAIVLLLSGAGFTLKTFGLVNQQELNPIIPTLIVPTQNPVRETAYLGLLHQTPDNKFYLVTQTSEAIILEIPANIKLDQYLGKRILASGSYNKDTGILKVTTAQGLEVLSQKPAPIPTIPVSPTLAPAESSPSGYSGLY